MQKILHSIATPVAFPSFLYIFLNRVRVYDQTGFICKLFPGVFSNVSSMCQPGRMHNYTGHICLTFLHCVFSNVSSNRFPERKRSHIVCISLICLQCEFSNVWTNYLAKGMHSYIACICLAFLDCASLNVSLNCLAA